MQYPLEERIGYPELLIGRKKMFEEFHQWIDRMPKRLSKSRVLLGRRKSGKTSFMQRLFNELWSANDKVIPFYVSVPERSMWLPDFAMMYYRTFASQYISFLERDPTLVRKPMTLEQIRAYGEERSDRALFEDADSMIQDLARGSWGLMWETAYRAPDLTAALYNQRILVMVDEFQYFSTNIHLVKSQPEKPYLSMPGSYHEVSESKVAPMLAAGSYVGWMRSIMSQYVRGGRLRQTPFSPYLTDEEGLEAVYKYAEVFDVPITNQAATEINELCGADPFFISCVVQSSYPKRDLMSTQGVIETVDYEVKYPASELAGTWKEYIDKTVKRINENYGKHILLHLSKYNDRVWTPKQLKEALNLDEDESIIYEKLIAMAKGDLIEDLPASIRFQGLQDGTLNLVLRHHFEEEIEAHQPDLRTDFEKKLAESEAKRRSLQSKYNNLIGKMAEHYLATQMRTRKRFKFSAFFNDLPSDSVYETRLNLLKVQTRIHIQREDGLDRELDIVAQMENGHVILVEVKNQKRKSSVEDVAEFSEKVALYQAQHSEQTVLAGFLSLGGFTDEALVLCTKEGIGWSNRLS